MGGFIHQHFHVNVIIVTCIEFSYCLQLIDTDCLLLEKNVLLMGAK